MPTVERPRMDGRALQRHATPWRPDIQGLRAIAVLSVLLFHLNLWPVGGGFVGVDVFFVISGYLISQVIFVEIAAGHFSYRRFYERRARRIVPVFMVTALLTTLIGCAVFYPSEYVGYAKTLIASAAFAANIFFYATHDYFGPSPESVPLLHLWSLGVEEQFYLVFPPFAVWGASLLARRQKWLVVVVGLLSFAASAALTHDHPTAAFYLLPFRAFEFLIGSYLALPTTTAPRSSRVAWSAGLLGLAAVAYAVFGFDATTQFPGVLAAVPCLGTGLLIWAGSGPRTAPTHWLSARPLTFFGDISYSLYMVHWPIIVLSLQWWPNARPIVRVPLAIAMSVALATVLFHTLEQPLRRARRWRGPVVLTSSALSLAAVAVVGFGIVRAAGFPGRVEAQVGAYLDYLHYNPAEMTRSRRCFLDLDQGQENYPEAECLPKVEPGRRLVVLWGDSVAAHLYPGLKEDLASDGVVLGEAAASACPPAIGYDAPQRPFCRAFNERVLALLLERKPALVIVTSSFGDGGALDHVEEAIRKLRAAAIPVLLIGPAPYYKEAVPKMLARRMEEGVHGNPGPLEMQDFVPARDEWAEAVARKTGSSFASLLRSYCSNGHCPLVTDDDVPIEYDPLHFTREGSRFVAGKIVGVIRKNL